MEQQETLPWHVYSIAKLLQWLRSAVQRPAQRRRTGDSSGAPKGVPAHVPAEVFNKEYAPPSTGQWETEREHRRAIRKNLKIGVDLLKEAGWSIRDSDKKLIHDDHRDVNGRHKPLGFEILLYTPTFERIVLPYAQNLKKLGVEATVQTIDTVRYQKRVEEFDFDVVVQTFGQSLSPGNEQRSFWGSAAADIQGSRNILGIKNPAIDRVIGLIIEAPTRESLVARTHALDRMLLWGHYVVPHWYYNAQRISYWDKFVRPKRLPKLGDVLIHTWWIDQAKAKTLAERLKAARSE